jgi:uncharacterized oxidoreductase
MPTVQAKALTEFSRSLFAAAGAPAETAQIVAESLVKSNLLGHDSHGVQLIPGYIKALQEGRIEPKAQPIVGYQTGTTAIVNGGWGFGQIVARFGVALAIKLAGSAGIGCVGLSQSNHIGRLGEYAQMLAEAGLIGLVLTGVSGDPGTVAAYGGRDRLFGTNPMAWALPVDKGRPPLVLDFATSTVAYGKVAVALSKGLPVAEGVLLDREGQPTTDPASLFDGGVLLPFGGHKGSGLALMIELITRGLAGFADAPVGDGRIGNPTLITAVAIGSFLPAEQFQEFVESTLQRVKNSRPAAGFDEVLLPGEPEARMQAQRSQDGIPIPETTWQKLVEVAEELGVAVNIGD